MNLVDFLCNKFGRDVAWIILSYIDVERRHVGLKNELWGGTFWIRRLSHQYIISYRSSDRVDIIPYEREKICWNTDTDLINKSYYIGLDIRNANIKWQKTYVREEIARLKD